MTMHEMTPEEIIQARDTKIAILQGALRAMVETAAENSRIKAEDHATITRYRLALEEIADPEKVWKAQGMTHYQQDVIEFGMSCPSTYQNIARKALEL